MRQLIGGVICLCLLSLSIQPVWGQSFTNQLQALGFDVHRIAETEAIARYDLARYLNGLRCEDCLVPSPTMRQEFNQNWFARLSEQQGYNLDDISQTGAVYQGDNYYYCVASVAENGYMFGFPKATSPYCRGKFCGASLVRYGDLIESLYRVIRPYVYEDYTTRRQQIGDWYQQHQQDLPVARGSLVGQRVEDCGEQACTIRSPTEFDLYLRFCSDRPTVCEFGTYPGFARGTALLGKLNVLIDEGVIPDEDATSQDRHQFVSGAMLLDYLNNAAPLVPCSFANDYDADQVANKVDSCPYTYNPTQLDTDSDTVGDVCDDDIDGDGRTHPVGVVDDEGNIDIAKYEDSQDNCLYTATDNEANADNDAYGDACDPDNRAVRAALAVSASDQVVETRQAVDFEAVYSGELQQLHWTYGDGYFGSGIKPTHAREEPGRYVVVAKATMTNGQTITAKIPVQVMTSPDEQVACQGSVNPLRAGAPVEVTLRHELAGEVQQVTWQYDDTLIDHINPAETDAVTHTFETPGRYRIDMQCYNTNAERVGLSQFVLEVGDDATVTRRASYTQAAELTPVIGETTQISTVSQGFDQSQIDRVVRDFGDGPSETTDDLTVNKAYTIPGSYVVTQIIFFNDDHPPLENVLTLYVVRDEDGTATSLTSLDGLVGSTNEGLEFELDTTNISTSEIDSVVWDCGYARTSRTSNLPAGLTHTCTYPQGGSYSVKATLYTQEGVTYVNELTAYVTGGDQCLTDSDTFRCDLDEDDIPDLCDTDIDGDGRRNRLGLIEFETADCSFTEENVDLPRLADYHARVRQTGSGDNCPFIPNTGQTDRDGDGYGTACDLQGLPAQPTGGSVGLTGDSDGDGIANENDACPLVPESNNGNQDSDGCPELPGGPGGGDGSGGPGAGDIGPGGAGDGPGGDTAGDFGDEQPFIEADKCEQCPCPYADYASELWKGDRVRALLLDEGGSIIYRYSEPERVERDVQQLLEGE